MPIGHASGAVVDGVLYVAVPGIGPAAGVEARFLGFHVGEDRWLDLEPPPARLDGIRLVAAGRHVVAVHGSHETEVPDDQIYDPASRTWAAVPRDPLAPSYDRTAVWTGAELVLFGIRMDPGRPANAPPVWSAATWNPALDEWRRLPDSQIAGGYAGWSIAGGRIVNAAIGGADGGEVNNWGRRYPFGGMLTSPAGEWSALPNPPEERGGFATLVAAGGEHVVTDGWVLHVPTGDWTPLERPPDGPDEGTAAVWAGDRLFAWGGVRWEPEQALLADGWTWRP